MLRSSPSSDRRETARVPAFIRVRKPGTHWSSAAVGDVSLGGASALVSGLPPATLLEVAVNLDGHELRALGTVLRTSRHTHGLTNMHLGFSSLPFADERVLARYMDTLIAHGSVVPERRSDDPIHSQLMV